MAGYQPAEVVDGRKVDEWASDHEGRVQGKFDEVDSFTELAQRERAVRDKAAGLYGSAAFPGAVVCLRFDDCPQVDNDVIAPLLASRQLPATFSIIGNRVGTAGNLTLAQILALQQAGHEIANHSWFHNPSGVPDSYAALQADTTPTDDLLTNYDAGAGAGRIWTPDTFVQPGGWQNGYLWDDAAKLDPSTETGRWMRSRYAVVAGYVVPDKLPGNTGRSFPVRHDTRIGGSAHLTASDLTSSTAVTDAIDAAILYKSQLTLLVHAADLDTAGKLTTAQLTTVLDYLVTKRAASELDVVTLATANYAARGARANLMVDPTFTASVTGSLKGGWVAVGTGAAIEAGGQTGNRAVVGYTNGLSWRYPAANVRSVEITGYVQPVSGSVASLARIQVQQGPSGGSTYLNRAALSSFNAPPNVWTPFCCIARADPRGGDLTVRPWVQNSSQGDVRYSNLAVTRI